MAQYKTQDVSSKSAIAKVANEHDAQGWELVTVAYERNEKENRAPRVVETWTLVFRQK
jgi:hypothetical protein